MMMISMPMMMMMSSGCDVDDFCVSWQRGRSLFFSRQFLRHVPLAESFRDRSPRGLLRRRVARIAARPSSGWKRVSGIVALGSCFGGELHGSSPALVRLAESFRDRCPRELLRRRVPRIAAAALVRLPESVRVRAQPGPRPVGRELQGESFQDRSPRELFRLRVARIAALPSSGWQRVAGIVALGSCFG